MLHDCPQMGISGFYLRGFIPLFVFGQNCSRSQAGEVRAGSCRKSQWLRSEGVPIAGRTDSGQGCWLSEWLLGGQADRFRFS